MERYYRPIIPSDGNFDEKKFSGFVEFQKPGVKEAILATGFTYTDFAHWIFDERLYPLNTVRLLPRILKNDEAKKTFLKEGARKAANVLERPDVSKALTDADVASLARGLSLRILKMSFAESQAIKQDPGGETAQELIQVLDNLRGLLGMLGLDSEQT